MIDLEYKVQRITEFKAHMNEWLTQREWNPNELYPFEGIEPFMNEAKEKLEGWGIQWIGWERLGETLTIGGEWGELGISLEINFNPIVEGDPHPFRVLYRWR